ncbi:hypothetical protein C6988_05815 [Nitrosopumilus sp. b1]|uniref:archaellin/type IV pilin N-terminal domain-containing protein n=1 Tax=Nitrosopumilus sp. b1 TaxID=2109907 RepID=UPI0015F3CA78|nr:archaellin/type IV pilin N-terminal domain-containing protein [Nitrosopumilus sp. b1]KAF6242706.1 hypothetical protein C6988_05815 [Nitrosopumilus sp. b1]
MTNLTPKEHLTNRRAVAPVIATLLMVAIAVVGGTIIFVFSQGFFSSSQISGTPTIEAVKILGYDARAVSELQAHNGNPMLAGSAGDGNPNVQADERVAVYVTNDSVQPVVIGTLRFAGYEYDYIQATGGMGLYNSANIPQGNYTVLLNTPDAVLQEGAAEIAPGQTATILMDLPQDLRSGRSAQFNIQTTNGNQFVGTVQVGQQSG